MADEPTMLMLESHPDAVDVPVDDLESVTLTRGDIARLEERVKNSTWRELRKSGALRREAMDAATARIEKLETLVSTALPMLLGLQQPRKETAE